MSLGFSLTCFFFNIEDMSLGFSSTCLSSSTEDIYCTVLTFTELLLNISTSRGFVERMEEVKELIEAEVFDCCVCV